MEDLVVIEEVLAKKMIDAGMDFVQVKYAVPRKIAELFKISSVQRQQPVVERAKKRKKSLPMYFFKVSKLAKQNINRMMIGGDNYSAAKMIIENFDLNEVVTKSDLQKKWSEIGLSEKFMIYGSGQMVRAGILTPIDEVSK